MENKVFLYILIVLFLFNIYGCAVVVAGAAGSAGTAAWLSGKMTQQVNASSEESLKAARAALKDLKLHITKETKAEDVIQIKSNYTDDRTIWIDIKTTSHSTTQIEVRVGAVSDKEAAKTVLDKILSRLPKSLK